MKSFIKKIFQKFGVKIERVSEKNELFSSLHMKYESYTMVPKDIFFSNLELVSSFSSINGSIVECGVWRGGMIAAMCEILKGRESILFDSFEGLPEAKEIDGINAIAWQKNKDGDHYFNNCKAEIDFAKKAMDLSGVKDYKLINGWFKDTLKTYVPNRKIAVLRLDADWYESTIDCLEALFDHVAPGGLIIIDDYHTWDGCSKALHEFLNIRKLNEKIYTTTKGVTYIVKRTPNED
jgi:O-methyltransferase